MLFSLHLTFHILHSHIPNMSTKSKISKNSNHLHTFTYFTSCRDFDESKSSMTNSTMSLDHVEWLSSLTLGEIWRACYNPPTPILAILVVALGFQIPRWYKFWIDWNLSRKVWSFDWPEPEVYHLRPTLDRALRRDRKPTRNGPAERLNRPPFSPIYRMRRFSLSMRRRRGTIVLT